MTRRQGRDTHVHGPARQAQGDAAILGQALLGDIEARHDLDARGDDAVQHLLRLDDVAQNTIQAEAHHGARLEGLDVNIRGALAHRLGQQGIDQAHDGRVVLALQQVRRLGQVLRQLLQIHVLAQIIHDLHGVVHAAVVGAIQRRLEVFRSEFTDLNRLPEHAPQFRQGRAGDAGTHPHLHGILRLARTDDAMALGEVIRQPLGGLEIQL